MHSCLMNATLHLACTFNDVVSYIERNWMRIHTCSHSAQIYSTCSFGPIQHSDMRTTIARIITTIIQSTRTCSILFIFLFWLLLLLFIYQLHLCGKLQCARTLKFFGWIVLWWCLFIVIRSLSDGYVVCSMQGEKQAVSSELQYSMKWT